jgi:hypothetical protein
MKRILIFLISLLAITDFMFASGTFTNPKSDYYFQHPSSVNVFVPAPSGDSFYVAKSYDGGTNWIDVKRDSLHPGNNSIIVPFTPDTLLSNVLFKLCTRESGIWNVVDNFTTNFIQSSGTFTDIKSQFYKSENYGGNYILNLNIIPEQLPLTGILQYKLDGGLWVNYVTDFPFVSSLIQHPFNTNYFDGLNIEFRVIYSGTNIIIASYPVTPIITRTIMFAFTTTSGLINSGNGIVVNWFNSSNFTTIKIIEYKDNIKKHEWPSELPTNLGTIGSINFETYGNYSLIGTVNEPELINSLSDTLYFNVEDPCLDFKAQIERLKADTLEMSGKIDRLNNTIVELHNIITELESQKKDTLITISLNTEQVVTEINYNTFETYNNNLIEGPCKVFIFDILGVQKGEPFIIADGHSWSLNSDNYTAGVYLIFITRIDNGNINLKEYKFIK